MKNRIKRLLNPQIEPINKIQIHSKNILHNFEYIQSLQPKSAIFPVLKSNAYGHGLSQITKILEKTDAKYLAVDSFPEYQIVKDNSTKNILVLGETIPQNYKKFDFSRATFCVYNIETIHYLAKLNKNIKIHLFLDTGMHREGVNAEALLNILEFIKDKYKNKKSKIVIEGVMSHLYSADEQDQNIDNISNQIALFKSMYHTIVDYGHTPKRKHIGNSAGLFKIKDDFFNAYRPGLALYGYSNLDRLDKQYIFSAKLKPALTITSKIISLKDIISGDGISYNHTRIASEDIQIASIPFGYFEGLPKSASNKIKFKLKSKNNSKFISQIGTICMNLSSLEIGESKNNIKIGDLVEIVGFDQKNSLQTLAENSDKIIYEVLVGFDRGIRREVV